MKKPDQKKSCVILEEDPRVVYLDDETGNFGEIEEFTSKATGAQKANIVHVTLYGPDLLHSHKIAEETYISEIGGGELFLDGEIIPFVPGKRVIIGPGIVHAARPKGNSPELVFLCVSSPPFDPKDVYKDPRGRKW
jgi:mannose-6-phosphate isomerase-like protein (cupin superfamily)